MWAGIKHAINSTLGTTKFKPLDKLMDDQTKEIEQYILRNKTFIPSNNTLITWDNAFTLISTTAGVVKTIGTFKPYISGFANLNLWTHTLRGADALVYIRIYEDNVLKREEVVNLENYIEDSKTFDILNVEFKSGKTYRFDFVAKSRGTTHQETGFHYLKFNADLLDGFPYDYTIGG